MKLKYGLTTLTVGLALFALGILAGNTRAVFSADEGRTEYERFDLSSPEAAVQTFVDTFQKRNYAGLYLIFASDTQQKLIQAYSTFRFDYLVDPKQADDFMEKVIKPWDYDQSEQALSLPDYMFDHMMLGAEENDMFSVDLRGKVEIGESQASETYRDDPAMDVSTTVEGIDGEVIFRMVQSPSGRWRVFQVLTPGGDETRQPWGVPVDDDTDAQNGG